MKALTHLTVKKMRSIDPEILRGPWVVREVDDGFAVRCGDLVLHSVNSRKPRIFRNLDTAFRNLRDELGVKEFKVETKN
jgi:hypothetical protein